LDPNLTRLVNESVWISSPAWERLIRISRERPT
jgi:hypothetical protein